jgi:hypothetical protein
MCTITVALAKRAMLLRESTPADPEDSIGGLSEIFRHPAFTEGSEEVRALTRVPGLQEVATHRVTYI